VEVDIGMMVDYKAIYMVGSGRLIHDDSGFRLTGCDGKLCYEQGPLACYSVYSDYNWYAWQRQQVRQEIEEGRYRLDVEVDIGMMVDYKAIYMVGEGHLTHDASGFHLTGCDGKLDYSQKPQSSYSLYADYYWYEIDDVIGIGDNEVHYFLFPRNHAPVAKVRLATEEMYKLFKAKQLPAPKE
jgi:hypothetical protein